MNVRRIYVEKKKSFAIEAEGLLSDICTDLSVNGLTRLRILNRYDISGITDQEYETAKTVVFSEPPVDLVYDESVDIEDACFVIGIESLPGQYDQRADSASQCVQIITQGEKPIVKTARIVVCYGLLSDDEKNSIEKYLINPVESRVANLDKPDTLEDVLSDPENIQVVVDFCTLSQEDLKKKYNELGLAMSFADISFIQDFFIKEKRDPTITEIRVLDTYWSDHCRHTTFQTALTDISFENTESSAMLSQINSSHEHYLESRDYVYGEKIDERPVCLMDIATMAMRRLKKEGKIKDLDESDEINACSIKIQVDIDGKPEDYILMFKNETHNHPTEIEPFGGAATCLGGAIRDPLSGRSYVYQAMRVTGAGDPRVSISDTLAGKLSQKKIVRTAAAGYSSYGNQIGLATGQVDEIYHPGYVAKRMEIGAVVGAAPADCIVRKTPKAGDVVLLLGGRTGRDGIGGATGSSKAHDEKSVITCGSEVQKGNPPTERKIQRLFRNPDAARKIIRCNDFGAGGVSVAVGELADGLSINLDLVPKKYEGLDGTELAISESQERMAIVLHPEDEEIFCRFAKEENLEITKIAVVTEEARMTMNWRGKKIVDLPRSFIDTNGAASYARVSVNSPNKEKIFPGSLNSFYKKGDFSTSLLDGLKSLEGCSRKGLVQRFDSTIGASTVLMPFGGKYQNSPEEGMAAKIPVMKGESDTVSLMTYGFDPYFSSWSPYHGAYHAVLESLLKLAAMGGDPTNARLTFQEYFERMTSEKAWGKSFAALLGAYQAQIDFQVPAIGGKDSMSGSFNDLHVPPTLVSFSVGTARIDEVVSSTIQSVGKRLWKISVKRDENGFYNTEHARRVLKAITQISKRGQLETCSVVRQSGIAVRLAQMLMGNHLGVSINDSIQEEDLFSRSFATVLLMVSDSNAVDKIEMVGGTCVGEIISEPVIRYSGIDISLDLAINAYEETLEPIFPTKTKALELFRAPAVKTKMQMKNYSGSRIAKPKVFIPVFPGTNCEYDSKRAFEMAGADVSILVIQNQNSSDISESLLKISSEIEKANILMLPGGFSAGDEPEGSGKFIAAAFRNPRITESVRQLLQKRDGLVMGICNGFQVLVKLGLLPYGDICPLKEDDITLTFNQIGRLQSGYTATKIISNTSPWLSLTNQDDVYWIPISHGEGRFVGSEKQINALFENNQVAIQYVDFEGNPSMNTAYNPNGSIAAIECITSPDGRIIGKMGHSERIGRQIGKNIPGEKDQRIFEAGVRYFQ